MEEEKTSLVVWIKNEERRTEAEGLAKHLRVPLVEELPESVGLVLCLDQNGLSLTDGKNQMQGDFIKMEKRLKQANLQGEFLVKAARLKGFEGVPVVVDATAGMGEDSLLLAAAGFQVILYEKDPVIAALLRDTLQRASQLPSLEGIVARMELREEDSVRALLEMEGVADVVLLDPMFPARQKSALIKKKFQLLQQLERPCSDEEQLLQAAIAAHPRKIVIKRPIKGPHLAGKKPDYSLQGKAIRYDCMVLAPR